MAIIVTGVAGFIGFHVAARLLRGGTPVIGIDSVNDYYDTRLKEARLAELQKLPGFRFCRINLADRKSMEELVLAHGAEITEVVHLAAQAGVRYSLINPYAYVESNITAQIVLLEAARRMPNLRHFVYASSSSVYGGNTKIPFAPDDPVDHPISLYAATKRADELFGYTYSHLHKMPMTGLRFFSVYGPWGRPDMAAYLFTDAILRNTPIRVFNHGKMRRDFTFIDDIVNGVIAAIARVPEAEPNAPAHKIYNLGNARSEALMDFIEIIEKILGKKAVYQFEPLQPGDVPESFADISASTRDLGYQPQVTISEGLKSFVDWYRNYHKISVV
ncbi:MAG: NAD-dependent epimerase/dehydratase family protein [Alphaproteobacteria bacterium]